MQSVFVARRPVFDRALDLVAYEIIASAEDDDNFGGGDMTDAVSRLVLEVAGGAGVDSILGERPAWLSLSLAAARQAADASLGEQSATIQLRSNGNGSTGAKEMVPRLQARGHRVALEVDPKADGSPAALVHGADIAVVDLAGIEDDHLPKTVEQLKSAGVTAAAMNVDLPERHEAAHAAGFDLFRGEFFKKPHSRGAGGVAPSRMAVLRLLGALQDPTVELPQLATLLSQDVTLTYRLLRYINSAFFGLRREVTSISHALALLGLRNVKRWATVIMLADVDHRPRELLTTALVRARFCELVGPYFRQSNADQLFTLGLFSVLDALMDTPMTKALRPLPLSEDMVGALTLRNGVQGNVLACALAVEQGSPCRNAPVDQTELAELYRQCLEWGTESAQNI